MAETDDAKSWQTPLTVANVNGHDQTLVLEITPPPAVGFDFQQFRNKLQTDNMVHVVPATLVGQSAMAASAGAGATGATKTGTGTSEAIRGYDWRNAYHVENIAEQQGDRFMLELRLPSGINYQQIAGAFNQGEGILVVPQQYANDLAGLITAPRAAADNTENRGE